MANSTFDKAIFVLGYVALAKLIAAAWYLHATKSIGTPLKDFRHSNAFGAKKLDAAMKKNTEQRRSIYNTGLGIGATVALIAYANFSKSK